jgi:hypothetical protein
LTVAVSTVLGRTYRFRYRYRNEFGWSDLSEISYILSAAVPNKPLRAPHLISVDHTQMTVGFTPSGESNGSPIIGYSLYMKHKIDGTYLLMGFVPVESTPEY